MKAETVKKVLSYAALGGLLVMSGAVVNPTKVIKALLKEKLLDKEPNGRAVYHYGKVIEKLIENRLIAIDKNGQLSVTEKGRIKLDQLEMDDFEIKTPKVWDKKFRVIIFDVPEEKKLIRKALRKQLVEWGFVRLQNSVWVYPYECQEAIALLKTHFGLTKDVLCMTVESIENDTWLKKEFGLS